MSAADLEQSRRRVLKAAEGQLWAGDLALLLAELDERRELAEAVDTEWRTTGKGECALCHGTHYYSQPMIAVPGKTVNTICPHCGPPPADTDSSGAELEQRRFEVIDFAAGEVVATAETWQAGRADADRRNSAPSAELGQFAVRPAGWHKQHVLDAYARQR